MKKIYYTYAQAVKDCQTLAKRLSRYNFDWIVTMALGGLVPTCLIGQLLKIKKVRVVPIHHYKGMKRETEGPTILASWEPPKNAKVLLIDDVVDTGKTMKHLYDLLHQTNKQVITASLHYKPKRATDFKPDHWVNETDAWVVYPWEINEND